MELALLKLHRGRSYGTPGRSCGDRAEIVRRLREIVRHAHRMHGRSCTPYIMGARHICVGMPGGGGEAQHEPLADSLRGAGWNLVSVDRRSALGDHARSECVPCGCDAAGAAAATARLAEQHRQARVIDHFPAQIMCAHVASWIVHSIVRMALSTWHRRSEESRGPCGR